MKKFFLLFIFVFIVSCDNGTMPDEEVIPEITIVYDNVIFSDDIEYGIKEWVAEPITGQWYIVTGTSHTLTHSWADDAGNYLNNTIATLTSRSFDLTNYIGDVQLTFWQAYDFEKNYDFGYVEYSIDNSTWIRVLEVTDRKYYFHEQKTIIPDVGGVVDFRIRFSVVTDSSGQRDGWYIDDIELATGREVEL